MAVVTAGANVALDMYNFEIGDLDGLRTYAGTSRIELKHGEGDYTDVYGNFYYDGFGEVYAGSVYEIETSYYGSLDYSITGLNLYADDFFDWVYSNDTDYAFSVMFAGADTFYGSDKADWLEGFGGNDRMYGYGGVDSLFGGTGSDYLDGGAGGDYMAGGLGDDVYIVATWDDRVAEASGEGVDLVYSAVAYSLEGSYVEDLTLTGTAGISATGSSYDNILIGNSGSNYIDGKGGADYMAGGQGNDVYVVDNMGDLVVEKSGEGVDLVYSSVAYSLEGSYVEDLTLTGTAGISAEGSSFDNILTGNSGSNFIDGKGGADFMEGGAGHDVYVVDNAGDQVVERAGEGLDLVRSSVSFTLAANVEDLTLTGSANTNGTGNSLVNILEGNSGNNILNGLGGADYMEGGLGNDTYYVDNASDAAIEVKGQGTDLVYSSVSYTLGASSYVEQLTLTGSANLNGTGNNIANVLTGNSGINVLTGYKGNDVYYVQNTGDTVVEAKDQGTDLVYSSVSFTLGATSYVEQLTLTGSANLNGTGNNIANVLTGNSGINVLTGYKGNDVYYVQNTGDTVVEAKGQGTDLVYSSVSFTLGASSYVERLTLTGSGNLNGTGNGIANVIVGNSGANRIDGLKGQDTLTGGGGADTFVWSATSHSTVSAADRVTDLSNADFIDLSAIDANTNAAGTQHFVLVDAFTNTAGQVTLTFDGTWTNLNADTNGDGVSDMLIRINGNHEDFDNFIFGG